MDPPPPYERTPSQTSAASASTRVSVLEMELSQHGSQRLGTTERFTLIMPRMHMCMAATCAVFNFILPGFGTILAAFSLFFRCSMTADLSSKEVCMTFCIGMMIGFLQLALAPVLLIGWIWSAVWGLAMIGISDEKYHGHFPSETSSIAGSSSRFSVPSASDIHLSRSSSISSSVAADSFPFEAIYASTATPGPSTGAESRVCVATATIPNTPPPPYEDTPITEVST